MTSKPRFDADTIDGSDSDGSEDDDDKSIKGKGKGKSKDKKTRSSKACDNCRKSKCKCLRIAAPGQDSPGPCQNCVTMGTECTFQGATRKRGPPKGYLEAVESRLQRMETLLGGLLQNDDPRAQHLLGELIGDDQAREILTRDLRAAAASAPTSKPRKSWKKAPDTPVPPPGPIISRGFPSSGTFHNPPAATTPNWFSAEELSFSTTSLHGLPDGSTGSLPSGSFGFPGNSLGLDSDLTSYRTGGGMGDSDEGSVHAGGINIPSPSSFTLPSSMNPRRSSVGSNSLSLSLPQHLTADTSASPASPRQRRRLNSPGGASLPLPPAKLFSFQSPNANGTLPASAINHTGQSSYSLSADAELSPGHGEDGVATQGMDELSDVVGQLSINENAEVRYHGRSSGLYLISKSSRYKDFFWQFPSAGIWPPADTRVLKTENEVLQISGIENPLPDRQTQAHLLDLYWCYVHPHFPILYKVSFMRQYRHLLSNPNSTEHSTPAGSGKVPVVLLLAMFALASRYSDLDPPRSEGKYWTAGQDYLEKARTILNFDYGSSKLVSVQALLLLAYREIGTGAMSASWMFSGMAIRMAQDLGLFRDVDKWFLPVQRFSHEEKQTRKRVWWGCIILDRYTSSYIGRPPGIMERDYCTSLPSEDEPDENEQWRPLRPDGTEWSSPPKADSDQISSPNLARYPPTRTNAISCFNAAGALAVIINRIITNIYAIRVRVLGQSSETLLSLLDQSLASWYLALPPHLAYNPAAKKVPPPHVLSLHLQFYSALILLHRPFIPGQNSDSSPTHFPSHSICTTSANAIANIVTTFSRTFSLRQCPPFLTYPIFSAAVICVYNAGFDEALARPAKIYLVQCMNALKEMEVIWGSAIRQYELLVGLVDLRDAELGAELQGMDARGTKRPAEDSTDSTPLPENAFADIRPANFHSRPLGSATPRRTNEAAAAGIPPPAFAFDAAMFVSDPQHSYSANDAQGFQGGQHSYAVLNRQHDASAAFPSGLPHRDFNEMLQSFLSTESGLPGAADGFEEAAFHGAPISVDGEQWAQYANQAFDMFGSGSGSLSPDGASHLRG